MSKDHEFDSEEASAMVSRVRAAFDSGKTRSCRWRASQLEALITLTDQNQRHIVQALHSDLSKPETEAFVHEGRRSSLIISESNMLGSNGWTWGVPSSWKPVYLIGKDRGSLRPLTYRHPP